MTNNFVRLKINLNVKMRQYDVNVCYWIEIDAFNAATPSCVPIKFSI